jgi:hypothetical protein
MWSKSIAAYNISVQAMTTLGNLDLNPIGANVHFNPNTSLWKVIRPEAPDRPDMVFDPNFNLVPQPPTPDLPQVNFGAAPTFDATPPDLPNRTSPGPLTATPPAGPPALDPVTVPDAPDIVLPDFPRLREIDLPLPPAITLPTFAGVRPDFSLVPPSNSFGFTPQQYSSSLVDAIRTKLQFMVDGKPGLPAAATTQMRDRLYSEFDRQQLRAEQEAAELFASRGFETPDGTFTRSIERVRQDFQDKRASAARDIYIKDVETAIEDLRFAIAQGAALEGTLMNNFMALQQLQFESARAAIAIAIDVFNAEVSLRNLELQAYQTDAQVYRDLIQAEVAKIEVYKAEIEGQRLIGEINLQDVQIYGERVKALLSIIELYKAEIDGAKAKADVNLSRTQAFVAQVQAYSERVKAYEAEWDAFAKQMEADLSRFRRYEVEATVYQSRVQSWAALNTSKIDQQRLRISEKELDINAFTARLQRIAQIVAVEAQRLDAVARVYGADIEKYRADAAVETVVSEQHGRVFALGVEQERSRVQAELQNAQMFITQATELARITVSKLESIAEVAATMSAGFASAMHVGADVHSGLSQSIGCSTSFQYSIKP